MNPEMPLHETRAATHGFGPIELAEPLELERVPTPALVVDVAALDRNLERMAKHAREAGIGLRPHSKTHKCPHLAHRQLSGGAVGICAAKVGEAEVMQAAGVGPLLVTSPVVTADKVERVVTLAERDPDFMIVVDSDLGATLLDRRARERGVTVGVLVDLDPGIRRTGVTPGAPAVDFYQRVLDLEGLRVRGLQAYAGHIMHVEGWKKRKESNIEALARCFETRHAIESAGHEIEIFTGGGTGTFDIDPGLDEFTDLQVGSYLFMDREYRDIGGPAGDRLDHFEPSLFVLATAISQPDPGFITVDAGFKSMATDTVLPEVVGIDGIAYRWGGDEHGILRLDAPSRPVELGDTLRLLVPHCDPTVNLFDVYHPVVDGLVSELWPIAGRGRSQ